MANTQIGEVHDFEWQKMVLIIRTIKLNFQGINTSKGT